MKRLLPLAVALAGCSLIPLPAVKLPDMTVPVRPEVAGSICYRKVTDQARPNIGTVRVNGTASYPAGTPAVSATVSFYARLDEDIPATYTYGEYRCVSPSSADQAISGPVTLQRGGPSQPYSLAGPALDAGVQRGSFWLGASLDVPGSPLSFLEDYGQLQFTGNTVTARLR